MFSSLASVPWVTCCTRCRRVASLRKAQPDWRIDWAVDERWVPLLRAEAGDAPVTSNLHIIPTRAWSRSPLSPATFGSIRTLRRDLRACRYDLALDLQGTIRSAVITKLAGATQSAGFADPRERAARRFYKQRIERAGTHVVEQNFGARGDSDAHQAQSRSAATYAAGRRRRECLGRRSCERAQGVRHRAGCGLGRKTVARRTLW